MTSRGPDASIGDAIRAERRRRGLSTRGLSVLSGVSQPMLSAIENGRSAPSIPTLYAVAEALGVGPADLLTIAPPLPEHGAPLAGGDADAATALTLLHAGAGRLIEAYRVDQRAGHDEGLAFQHSGEDVIHVLEGSGVLRYGDEELSVSAGDTVWIDGGVAHGFRTSQRRGLVALVITVR